ncbi:MAG: DUF1194 domain-containing protein [Rhodospirillales bacterium]
MNRHISRLRDAAGTLTSAFCVTFGIQTTALAQIPVDIELVLALDCSYSVDSEEFSLQVLGLSDAFRSPEVIKAIRDGQFGRIGVSLIQWSSYQSQELAIGWSLVDSADSAAVLSARIANMPRVTAEGATSISGALAGALDAFQRSPFSGTRRVIDVSGDGRNNSGPELAILRARVLAQNITINGLAILNDVPTLDYYYNQQLIGGPAAFTLRANDYEDYIRAIRMKLLKEIRSFPVSDRGSDEGGDFASLPDGPVLPPVQ